jgi:hypothetical protein
MRTTACASAALCCAALLCLAGCRSAPVPAEGRLVVPPWYEVTFILHYPDGRRYEGECAWPPSYDRNLRFDIDLARGHVRPGKKVLSKREVSGPRVFDFPPDGRGTMYYPDGRKQTGAWRRGRYVGGEGNGRAEP